MISFRLPAPEGIIRTYKRQSYILLLIHMTSEKVSKIRELMEDRGFDAYIIPSSDDHQNEYVPDYWQRRRFITGFTGSAGDAVITADHAGLWTDGRYFIQSEEQLDTEVWTLHKLGLPESVKIPDWLGSELGPGSVVGLDPKTVSVDFADKLEEKMEELGMELRFDEENLVDMIWEARPDFPSHPVELLPVVHSGKMAKEKLSMVREKLEENGVDHLVVTALDSVCWLFNIRGQDIDYNPVVISYALVDKEEATLFIEPDKIGEKTKELMESCISLRPYRDFKEAIRSIPKGDRVWIDPSRCSRWALDTLATEKIHRDRSPIADLKAVKNEVEIKGINNALKRDGAAMVKFLHWLESAVKHGNETELSAAEKLEDLRSKGENFKGLSFETISAYGPHGAVIHYSATEDSDVPLEPKGLYLVDSGAQYLDGTTDITRTIALGEPTEEEKRMFTLVLKGHTAIARLLFPKGTCGKQLDAFARKPLWDVSLNYNHGTGHGVGHYLNVHEGPQSISKRDKGVTLSPGMIISNEPGYYQPECFGIRIENLVLVTELDEESEYGPFYGFETLTLCPIDLGLLKKELLTLEEREWLNSYHRTVLEKLGPLVGKEEKEWLEQATRQI